MGGLPLGMVMGDTPRGAELSLSLSDHSSSQGPEQLLLGKLPLWSWNRKTGHLNLEIFGHDKSDYSVQYNSQPECKKL